MISFVDRAPTHFLASRPKCSVGLINVLTQHQARPFNVFAPSGLIF